jgi:hypothetical protein
MIKEILKINNNKLKFSGFRLKQNPKKLVPSLRKLKNFFKFKTKRDFQNDLKEFVLQQKKLH